MPGYNPKPLSGSKTLELSQADLMEFAGRLELAYHGPKSITEFRYSPHTKRAQNLLKNEPARYARIALKLLEGQPITHISREEHTDKAVVRIINLIHPDLVEAGKLILLSNLQQLTVQLSTRLLEDSDYIPTDKIAPTLAIIIDKLSLLSGGVTNRTEHLNVPSAESLQAMFDKLPSNNNNGNSNHASHALDETPDQS
jgi:hypothetical protein